MMPEIFSTYTRYEQLCLCSETPPALTKVLESTKDKIVGDYYEFGLYAGFTFYHAQQEAKRLNLDYMNFWGFDSFCGLPEVDELDAIGIAGIFSTGAYACDEETVRKLLNQFVVDWGRTHLIAGWYDDTLTDVLAIEKGMKQASVILVDCDLYQSTVPVLKFIEPLVQSGTVILFDDWNCFGDSDKGERRAFREFLEAHPKWNAEEFFSFGWHGQSFIMHRKEA
jgi:O-methyltransferase